MDEKKVHSKSKELVANNVFVCQTSLIEKLLVDQIFSYDDICNLTMTDEEILKEFITKPDNETQAIEDIRNSGEDQNEIFEWWVVSNDLLNQLKNEGEPILENEYGSWWGRTCSGQQILLDSVIIKIATRLFQ